MTPNLWLTLLLFVASAGAIYLACEFFVNGVEWVGRKLGLAETATGTVLAAIGTALPESAVTFMAVAFGDSPEARDIGVGAALGGPLVLATIGYAVVGVSLLTVRRRLGRGDSRVVCNARLLARDQGWFLVIFFGKLALGVVAFAIKPWLGILFLVAYAAYVATELRRRDEAPSEHELEPLKLAPHGSATLTLALVQTLGALVVIGLASRLFVVQLEGIGVWAGLPAQLVALLLSPIATEMPEIVNALIWVRQGRERLALANLSGAMMAQATVPAAIGLFYTPWLFSADLVVAGAVTVLATAWLFLCFHRGRPRAATLVPVLAGYLLFAVAAWLL